jgi:hypothetical protein
MSKLGKPYMLIKHFMPYFAITMINRILVLLFAVYIMVKFESRGDLLFVPIIQFVSGVGIIFTRVVTSDTIVNCITKAKQG